MKSSATTELRKPREDWPVRIYRLGDEPGDDQSQLSTPEERLAMMWELAVDAWSLTGQPMPDYARPQTPVTCRPWAVSEASHS